MPLFHRRAPQPFMRHRRVRQPVGEQSETGTQQEPEEPQKGLRHYPLNPDVKTPQRGAKTVEPLPHPRVNTARPQLQRGHAHGMSPMNPAPPAHRMPPTHQNQPMQTPPQMWQNQPMHGQSPYPSHMPQAQPMQTPPQMWQNQPMQGQSPYPSHMPQAQPMQAMPQMRPMQNPIHTVPQIQPMQQPMHNQPMHTSHPAMPSASPSPEKAAEQFRRVNSGLPDGVKYEPLDDETMRVLQKHAKSQQSKTPSPPTPQSIPSAGQSPPQFNRPTGQSTPQVNQQAQQTSQPAGQTAPSLPPSPTLPEEAAKTLENLAQDERNAHIFYSHYAQSAPTDTIKKAFATLSKDSENRIGQYTSLLSRFFNRNFVPIEKEVNTNLSVGEAISLALSEENKALITLGNLLEQTANPFEKSIERIISRKIIGHQLLLTHHR